MARITKFFTPLEAADILGITGRNDQDRQNRCISRLVYLGYTEDCSRCGGCGRYSFNQMDGDRCYGCGGTGKKLVKLSQGLLDGVKARIKDGALEPYFVRQNLIAKVKKLAADARKAWHDSAVGKEYNVHRTPHFTLEEREAGLNDKFYDEFFASPLFCINKQCGDLFTRCSEIELRVSQLNWFKDAVEIDALLTELQAIRPKTEELDRQYIASKVQPRVITPVFAHFSFHGTQYFVRVSAATSSHMNMAQDVVRKLVPYYRITEVKFEGWRETATEFLDLYPNRDALTAQTAEATREALTAFVTKLSESREAIEDAVRE